MSRRRHHNVNARCTSQAYWNTVLKGMGMGVDAGKPPKARPTGSPRFFRRGSASGWSKGKARGHAKRTA